MCGSIRDSIIAGSIIYGVAAIFVLSNKAEYIWLGSLLFVIGTIQIMDALIWAFKQFDISTDWISRYAILTILLLEPVVAYLGYLYYYGKVARLPIYEISLAVFILISVYNWIAYCEDTSITRDGYLKWCGVDLPPFFKIGFLILLGIPMLFFPNLLQKLLIFVSAFGTWMYNFNHEAFGSRWCYSSILYVTAALIAYLAH